MDITKIIKRTHTKQINVGGVIIGGQNKVVLQSMTTTKTHDVEGTLKQIQDLVNEGCEIVRVAVVNERDLPGLKEIVKRSPVPIVADIHFRPELALAAIDAGCVKIRLNPGNIPIEQLAEIVEKAKLNNVAIRVGVNSGSLPFDLIKSHGVTAEAMLIAARRYIKIMEDLDFTNIVLSLKTSSPLLAIESYNMAAKEFKYPLHLGITEAGSE
jgi:(E)-4-hydroxy-3-methylbut-2-enyl-diphosphate synthase